MKAETVLASLGYFDAPGQTEPVHDPKLCAICGEAIGDEARLCRSLMVSFKRSYFFTYHVRCKDDDLLTKAEHIAVDEMFDCDDAA